jgi:hypothetical protein
MAPLIQRNDTTTIVLIVGLVLLAVVCLGLFLALMVSRLRKQKSQEISEKTPGKWHNFLKPSRKAPAEMEPAFDDIQREVLIRKSLASRHGSMSSGPISPATDEDIDIEEQQDLRTDWKKWEARVQHERSVSLEEHPALGGSSIETGDLNIHPALRANSPSWSPLGPLPRLPTLSAAPPAPAYITGGPSYFLSKDAGGAKYGPVATDDDNKF